MAHLGLLALESWDDITLLKADAGLHSALQRLDGMSTRDQMSVDVTYVKERPGTGGLHCVDAQAVRYAHGLLVSENSKDSPEDSPEDSQEESQRSNLDTEDTTTSLLEFHAFLASLGWPEEEYLPPDIEDDEEEGRRAEEMREEEMREDEMREDKLKEGEVKEGVREGVKNGVKDDKKPKRSSLTSRQLLQQEQDNATRASDTPQDTPQDTPPDAFHKNVRHVSPVARIQARATLGRHRLTGSMRLREKSITQRRLDHQNAGTPPQRSQPRSQPRSRTRSRTRSASVGGAAINGGELQHTGFHHVMSIRVPAWHSLLATLTPGEREEEEREGEQEENTSSSTAVGEPTVAAPVRVVWNDSTCRYTPGTTAWRSLNVATADMTIVVDPLLDQPTLCAVRVFTSKRLQQSVKLSKLFLSRPGASPPIFAHARYGVVVVLHVCCMCLLA